MHTIAQGKEIISSLWGGHADTNDQYRLMRYSVITESDSGGTLLLNTVTGELVQLSTAEADLLEILPHAYEPRMDELIAHRFLVPVTFDELTSVTQLRRVVRNLSYPKDEVAGYTILPTTACNARCFYCYESEYPRCSMSDETIEQLINYIDSHCGSSRKIHISWFGGEPTLGEKCIDYVCARLKARNIAFSSSMISNGYLFSKAMARKAKDVWQLRSIQITLDGTEEVYNSVKAYVNPDGNPYYRVIDNIGLLLDEKIHVSVRMNLDRHNADNLKALIDELADRFQHDEYFSVYVHEIFEGMGYEPIQRTEDEMKLIIEKMLDIETYIDHRGLKRPVRKDVKEPPCLKVTYCMADNPSAILVNPQGKLGKCQHMQYDHLIGDLWKGYDSDQTELHSWMECRPREGCNVCPLFPSCGVPQMCASGRTCLPVEVDRKLNAVRMFCCKLASQQL